MERETPSLEELIKDLPSEMRSEIKDFVEFLLHKRRQPTHQPREEVSNSLRETGEEYALDKIDLSLGEGQTHNATIVKVVKHMKTLPDELQARVLTFVKGLEASEFRPSGTSGDQLSQFWGAISPAEAQQMRDVIKAGCERIDADEW